jgi:hypothetical protein
MEIADHHHTRRAREADRVRVFEEGVHCRRPRAGRPRDCLSYSDHTRADVAAGQWYFPHSHIFLDNEA